MRACICLCRIAITHHTRGCLGASCAVLFSKSSAIAAPAAVVRRAQLAVSTTVAVPARTRNLVSRYHAPLRPAVSCTVTMLTSCCTYSDQQNESERYAGTITACTLLFFATPTVRIIRRGIFGSRSGMLVELSRSNQHR